MCIYTRVHVYSTILTFYVSYLSHVSLPFRGKRDTWDR